MTTNLTVDRLLRIQEALESTLRFYGKDFGDNATVNSVAVAFGIKCERKVHEALEDITELLRSE